MDRGCAAYENGISESYHNSIRIARGKPLITMLEEIRVYLMQRLYSMHNLATNLVDSITPSKWWDLSGVPCVHSVAAFSFLKNDPILGVSAWYSKKMWQNAYSYFIKQVGGSSCGLKLEKSLLCHQSLERCQGHNKKSCKKEKQPKPTVEKRAPGRKKAGSNFVFQAGPSVADPSSAGPSVADPSSAGPSVANSTGSGTQAATVTEDPIVADPTDDIPTQQSKTSDTAKIIEDAIATGRLKTAGLKRRCKSERIAKRAKAFQFGKDGAGSCSEKAWDVDDVLAEK
ncbi:hypothetical protein Tco_0958458 [Tanacetum coccineum]